MNTFIYLSADTSIYKHKLNEDLNTGFDEILEIENSFSESAGHHVSRVLIKFDINTNENYNLLSSSDFFLNLKITESKELSSSAVIEVLPLKSNWTEGFGRKYDNINADGATWNSSSEEQVWNKAGGDVYSETELYTLHGIKEIPRYEFRKRTSDVIINITNYVELWNSGVLENNGIMVKFKDETISACGKLSFFSKDTNTIYQPYIKVGTNDYVFNPCGCKQIESITCVYDDHKPNLTSGSINQISGSVNTISGSTNLISGCYGETETSSSVEYAITNEKPSINFISHDNILISPTGIKSSNSVREQHRVRIKVREKFPVKKFSNKSRYTDINFVDYPMYYSVVDADTLERVIFFDKYSRISCDGEGHYFDFDFGCLSIDRVYYFEIRVESLSQTKIFEDEIKFKVIR